MERPIFKPVGSKVEELDTPALVIDLEALEQNLETVHSFFRDHSANLRPHIESHRCPAVAHKQLTAGGTVGGICVNTVGEAEVFAENGFKDIFIASEIVTRQKIARLCGLAHHAKVTVAVDNADNVSSLSEAAQNAGVTLNAVVDIHTRIERCGVEPGEAAVGLAKVIQGASNLSFAGLMSYEGAILSDSPEELASESRKYIQQVLDTREMVEKAGLEVDMVSVGGTHNYEIAGAMTGVTEVPAGSYALMDYRYSQHRPQLRTAAKVLASVISQPEPELCLMDTGQKAIGIDLGLPVAESIPGTTVSNMSAEHGFLRGSGLEGVVDLGGKLFLTPWEIGTTVNLYDNIHAVRGGVLEAVWDVSARGRYR